MGHMSSERGRKVNKIGRTTSFCPVVLSSRSHVHPCLSFLSFDFPYFPCLPFRSSILPPRHEGDLYFCDAGWRVSWCYCRRHGGRSHDWAERGGPLLFVPSFLLIKPSFLLTLLSFPPSLPPVDRTTAQPTQLSRWAKRREKHNVYQCFPTGITMRSRPPSRPFLRRSLHVHYYS